MKLFELPIAILKNIFVEFDATILSSLSPDNVILYFNSLPPDQLFDNIGHTLNLVHCSYDDTLELKLHLSDEDSSSPMSSRNTPFYSQIWVKATKPLTNEAKMLWDQVFHRAIYVNLKSGYQIESKFYKRYVIYDMDDIKSRISKHTYIIPYLHVWTGGDKSCIVPFWAHFAQFDQYPLSTNELKITYPVVSGLNDDEYLRFFQIETFSNTTKHTTKKIGKFRKLMMAYFQSVDICMTVGQYCKFRMHMLDLDSRMDASPVNLRLCLTDINTGGTPSDTSYDNDTMAKMAFAPLDFPIYWVTKIFEPKHIKSLTLDYFAPGTKITDLNTLVRRMPKLESLVLEFGCLEVSKIAGLKTRWRKLNVCDIQLKMDYTCFRNQLLIDKKIAKPWLVVIVDDYVVLSSI